eukprot:TRINITY_DN14551_c0_g1_i2.p1 TRINITY_DN14551_c0_g1~~TRINITY_DN14551_c0_g1_i2.p1  ORF type:complete len:635 (+),score=151.39 TRINITY_DN14551_c0_g1_i2:55-1959(+)
MAQPLPTLPVDKGSSSTQALGRGSIDAHATSALKKFPMLPLRGSTAQAKMAVGGQGKPLAVVGFPRASTAARASSVTATEASRPVSSSLTPPPTSDSSVISSFGGSAVAQFGAATASPEVWAAMRHNPERSLEEENQRLREELARYQCSAMERHRRPMAAIAGGGFRGSSSQQPRNCNCEALKVKLARCRAELREALRQKIQGQQQTPPQTSALPPPTPKTPVGWASPAQLGIASAEEMGCIFPPAPGTPAAAEVQGSPQTPRSPWEQAPVWDQTPMSPSSLPAIDRMAAQTPIATAEAGIQTSPAQACVEVQAEAELPAAPVCEVASVAIQATCIAALAACAAVQTADMVTVECGTQVVPKSCDASQQASVSTSVQEAGAQTESRAVAEVSTQAVPEPCVMNSADVQTETEVQPAGIEEGVQADIEISALPVATGESSVQTVKAKLCAASVQTSTPSMTSSGTQVAPIKTAHQSVQVEDDSERKEKAVCEARVKDLEACLQNSNSKALEEVRKCKEDSQAWQQMAQSKALGQMNITILCPRAECTVNGTRVEIDSWNPKKLRQEFEDQVLPRFTKLFVEESPSDAGPPAKPEALQRTMEEFANVFRERLSAMLSAPNANAAVLAASQRATKTA